MIESNDMRRASTTRFRSGQKLTAAQLNDLARQLSQNIIGGRGINVTRLAQQVTIELSGNQIIPLTSGGASIEMQITGIKDDYLECQFANDLVVNVLKPFLLQRTPFDGQAIPYPDGVSWTYTYDATNPERKRSATDGTTTETQIMTPMYFVDELIIAERYNPSLFGVGNTTRFVIAADGTSTPITWIDKNNGARHWAV